MIKQTNEQHTTGELSNDTTSTIVHHGTVVHLLCSHISSSAPSPIAPCRFMDMTGGDARGAVDGECVGPTIIGLTRYRFTAIRALMQVARHMVDTSKLY